MSYKKNYIKIYFWQTISFILNFVALFIVTPLLSGMPTIYGIYSVCVSLNIFLQYADIGFLMAGKKFASETTVTKDVVVEKKIVGTSMMVYIFFSLLITCFIFFCYLNPNLLVSGIKDSFENTTIASSLLLILLISIPITVLQKYADFIYSLRLEEYKVQKYLIIGNIIKIASVPTIFFNNTYNIVGYYLFCQIVMLICDLYILYKSKEIGYGILSIFQVTHFDLNSFHKMKSLALGGFGSTMAWILYYEIDNIGISAILGAKVVAIYAIGRSIQSFIRSLTGIVYEPFFVRFNYFIGSNDLKGMMSFFLMLSCLLSFSIIPIISICFFSKPFVISWVGADYLESSEIMQVLVLCFIFNSLTNPCASIIFAFNKAKDVLKVSVVQPLIFWIGVFVTIDSWGVKSFAYFKFIACFVTALYYIYIATRILRISPYKYFIDNFIKPCIVAVIISAFFFKLSDSYLSFDDKSVSNVLIVIAWISLTCLVSLIGYITLIPSFRRILKQIIYK